MTLKITIDLDNAAFDASDDGDGSVINGPEIARILGDLAAHFNGHVEAGDVTPLMDSNGNKVGKAVIV